MFAYFPSHKRGIYMGNIYYVRHEGIYLQMQFGYIALSGNVANKNVLLL